jgi:DNA repair photolyase
MNIKEINSKACMVKSKLTDYVINPYTGCSHGCKYCYADFIKRFQNIKDKWGTFVYAKTNCSALLEKELETNKEGNIFMSSVCDCYMPEESKFRLTRKIFETIVKSKFKDKFTFEILTKSKLVQRDFDLIKQLKVELGMSINQLDEKIATIIEPNASSPAERIETLTKAKAQGIKTFGFISPVLPGITNLDKVFSALKKAEVDYVWVELFNMRKSAIDKMIPIYKEFFPEKLEEFRLAKENQKLWHEQVRKQARELENKYNLAIKEIVVHGE